MPDTPTTDGFWNAAKVFVEEYNSASKVLTLAMLLWDLELTETSDPYNWAIALINEFYQSATTALMEQLSELAQVEQNSVFPDLAGNPITIQEDYLLVSITPFSYVPASVIDPQTLLPFKYVKVTLHYIHKPDFDVADLNLPPPGWQTHPCLEDWGFPPYVSYAWPYPNLGEGNPPVWTAVWMGSWNSLPTGHWRYKVQAEWLILLQADPADPDYWMQEDIYDCYREAIPSDGSPWYNPDSPKWISRGINDSWVDSYDELKNRGYAPNAFRRELRWFANAGWTDYRFRQDASNDYVEVTARPHYLPGDSCTPYGGGGAGTLLPGLVGIGQFLPLLHFIGFFAPWLKSKKEG
jgi:hypothetical protein